MLKVVLLVLITQLMVEGYRWIRVMKTLLKVLVLTVRMLTLFLTKVKTKDFVAWINKKEAKKENVDSARVVVNPI